MDPSIEKHIAHWKRDEMLVQTLYLDNHAELIVQDTNGIERQDRIELDTEILMPVETIYLSHNQVIVPSDIVDCTPEVLLSELMQYYQDNLLIDEEVSVLMTGYTLYTWFYDKTHTAPYIYIQGDKGTAKSRILDLMSHTCFNAASLGAAVTEANIYRMQEISRGTMVIDELEPDFTGKSNKLTQILNNGYKQDGIVMRSERIPTGGFKPVPFNVFGPKVIASRSIPDDDALRSRCFLIRTTEKKLSEVRKHNIPLEFTTSARKTALQLRNKLLGLRFGYYEQMPCNFEQSQSESLTPRAAQIIDSILSVVPEEWLPGLRIALENHLFEDGISIARKNERLVQDVISRLSHELAPEPGTPVKISYANICDKIMLTEGLQFTSKDVGSIVANLGFEAVRTSSGMEVIYRNVGNVADVGEIEACDTDDVEDVANVVEHMPADVDCSI